VWMGYSDAPRPLEGIKGVRAVTGGSLPADTWESFMREALAGVPVTEFTEPPPITDLTDILRRRARGGFDVRTLRAPLETDPGVYVRPLPAPSVEPPPPPTTTTTVPQDGDDLDSLLDSLRQRRAAGEGGEGGEGGEDGEGGAGRARQTTSTTRPAGR
ncbi:MAG TPA: hypothetical protein VGV63_10320, partial [Acidimicrobiales bacterium]|nr:hypothetical protein [Acidimicrobiales bacterium]